MICSQAGLTSTTVSQDDFLTVRELADTLKLSLPSAYRIANEIGVHVRPRALRVYRPLPG